MLRTILAIALTVAVSAPCIAQTEHKPVGQSVVKKPAVSAKTKAAPAVEPNAYEKARQAQTEYFRRQAEKDATERSRGGAANFYPPSKNQSGLIFQPLGNSNGPSGPSYYGR